MPVRVPLSFRRVVLLAGPLRFRFRLRRWRFDALRRQIEIAVESADRQTIKEYMGNAAVFVIASSADFKPAEKLLAFAAQAPARFKASDDLLAFHGHPVIMESPRLQNTPSASSPASRSP